MCRWGALLHNRLGSCYFCQKILQKRTNLYVFSLIKSRNLLRILWKYLRWEKTKISIFLKYSKYFHKFLWNGRALPKPLRKIWRALGFGHLKLVSVCMVFLTIFQWQMFVISNDWSGAAVRARWIPQRPPARRNQMSPSFRFSCGPSWKCIGQAEAGLRGPHSIAGLETAGLTSAAWARCAIPNQMKNDYLHLSDHAPWDRHMVLARRARTRFLSRGSCMI